MDDVTVTPARAVMNALWPLLGGNHTEAELWNEIAEAVDKALADAQGEPVAWMYARGEASHVVRERVPDLKAFEATGWTETPLYTHPPAQDEMCKHYVVERDSRGRRTCVSCGTALAHPPAQGEPVAWMYERERFGRELRIRRADNLAELGWTETPLYTHPPAQDVEALVSALKAVLPYVATQTIGCHGYKCREMWCWSCNGEDEAELAAENARTLVAEARTALAALKGESAAEMARKGELPDA